MKMAPPSMKWWRHRMQPWLGPARRYATQPAATCSRNGIALGGLSEAARADARSATSRLSSMTPSILSAVGWVGPPAAALRELQKRPPRQARRLLVVQGEHAPYRSAALA